MLLAFINFANPTFGEFGENAVMRKRCVGKQPLYYLFANSLRQIHPFQQILESRVGAQIIQGGFSP